MDNTSTNVPALYNLKDVKTFFNKNVRNAVSSITKALKDRLVGKHFIVQFHNLGPDWNYIGEIINVKLRRDDLGGVILVYKDNSGRDEWDLDLLQCCYNHTSSESIQFFDDESSAKLFIETTKLI